MYLANLSHQIIYLKRQQPLFFGKIKRFMVDNDYYPLDLSMFGRVSSLISNIHLFL